MGQLISEGAGSGVIISSDGNSAKLISTEITGLSAYNTVIDSCKAGDTIEIAVSRNGRSLAVKVKLTEVQSSS